MPNTWGISEADFVGVYLIALSGALLFAFAVRTVTRSGAAHSTPAPEALPALALACLTGGPRRVVEAAVAQLVNSGQLRLSRSGFLELPASTARGGTNPVERTLLADVARHGRRSAHMLIERLSHTDAVQEVVGRLVADGLLVDPALAVRRKRIGMIPFGIVLGVGMARWLVDIQAGQSVGVLTVLLLGSGVLGYALLRQGTCPRTFRGATVVTAAGGMTGSVATGGFGSHPDLEVRQGLLASSPAAAAYHRRGHAENSGSAHLFGENLSMGTGDGGGSCGGGS